MLAEAFRKRGPGTFVHPWLGEFRMVLAPDSIPSISFDQRKLRVAEFTLTLQHWREAPEPAFDTLGLLLVQTEQAKSAIRAMLRDLLAPARLAFGAVSAVAALASWAAGSFGNLLGGLTNGGALLGLLRPQVAALGGLGSAVAGFGFADMTADAFAGVPDATAGVTPPATTPAIAPSAEMAADSALLMDAADVATALLTAAAWQPPATILPPSGVVLALHGYALMGAIAAAARISFASQQDAMAWKVRLDAAIRTQLADLVQVAVQAPRSALALRQALADLRIAVARDFDAELGRLPAVRRITVPSDASLWLMANHLAGADASLIVPLLDDMVVRNALRSPGVVRAGTTLEYLA